MDQIIVVPYKNEWMVINVTKYKRLKKVIGKSNAKKKSHTHVQNEGVAYILKRNVMNKTLPKTRNNRLLISHLRICNDSKYKEILLELIRGDNLEHKKYSEKGGEIIGNGKDGTKNGSK